MKIIAFTKVSLPGGWLGNMAPYPIAYNGCQYRTSEALFQAMRFRNPEIVKKICDDRSPFGAKLIAKMNAKEMVVSPRSPQDVANMEMVLKLKLEQHPELRELLQQTGDAQIIEDCTNRANESGLFWGAARRGKQWVGQNMLGKLWMKLRG